MLEDTSKNIKVVIDSVLISQKIKQLSEKIKIIEDSVNEIKNKAIK
ncbi:MAG: hypothetical protein ACXACC_10100 [Promethearchaeota archaeon]|jgi:hypothetical protein